MPSLAFQLTQTHPKVADVLIHIHFERFVQIGICFLLQTLLGRAGYDVAAAKDLAEALEAAGRELFDLYILDTWVGEESGIDLCRALKAAHPDTPVIFYSAAAFDSDRDAALRAGAYAYVTKPGTDELAETVRCALGAG